VTRLAFPFLCN
jgi:hypothetical protein